MERERLLATIDEELSSGAPSKIQRVRLLDLWWRVATEDGLNNAKLGPADRIFLSHLVLRTARRSATLIGAGSGPGDTIFTRIRYVNLYRFQD